MHVISNSVSRWFSNKLAISNLCTWNMDSNLFPVIAREPKRNPTLRNTNLDQSFLTIRDEIFFLKIKYTSSRKDM